MPSVSLLVAAYNEEASLEKTLERALTVLRECSPDGELIILDDKSTDRTPAIADAFAAKYPREVRVMHHAMNGGIAKTFEDLYKAATKQYVFLISGDGEYPPEALRQCMPLLPDYEIVICRRTVKQYTLYRHIISNGWRYGVLLLFGIDLIDPGSVKVVKRTLFTDIPVRCRSVFVEAERLIKAVQRGARITSVDIEHQKRVGGRAGGGRLKLAVDAAKDLLSLWWELVVLRKSPEPFNHSTI